VSRGDSLSSHVEPPRALVRVDKLAEGLLVLAGVELGLGVSVGVGLGLELGDVDVVDRVRDLVELEAFRVCVAGSVSGLFASRRLVLTIAADEGGSLDGNWDSNWHCETCCGA
jgi:hypothetical protein